jgi:hypothetical protein
MINDIDKFIGEWENETGNLLMIKKKNNRIAFVTLYKGPNFKPVLRPYCGNSLTTNMISYLEDYGSTLVVDLWKKGKGFTLDLTYEYCYDLDKDKRDSLVPALSRYEKDKFLEKYYSLFEPLDHYTRKDGKNLLKQIILN